MADKIQINMLGKFTLNYQGRVVSDTDNRSKKIWTLLGYLIANHSRKITHKMLTHLLWQDAEVTTDSENALKTLLHRTRAILDTLEYREEKLIIHRGSTFSWNNAVNFSLDIDNLEYFYAAASDEKNPLDVRMENYRQVLSLYNGRFLPKNCGEDWAIQLADHYHSLYLNAVHSIAELLLEKGKYDEVIHICLKSTNIDPCDELSHYSLIRSFNMTGQQNKAMEQYKYMMQLFYDKFGINPSEEITNLYREIVKEQHPAAPDLSVIKEKLTEQNAQKGAYFCDFSIFQNIYHIEARSAARSGLAVFLCLITIQEDKLPANNSSLAAAMARMAEAIGQSVRSGDVYARYSASQFIILLPAANYENCTAISSRIIKSFQAYRPKFNVSVSCMLDELDPLMFE